MTPPTEDEARAWLSEQEAFLYGLSLSRTLTTDEHTRHALLKTTLALLDEARKDKPLVDDLLVAFRALDVGQRLGDVHKAQPALLNWRKALAAIDQARGA